MKHLFKLHRVAVVVKTMIESPQHLMLNLSYFEMTKRPNKNVTVKLYLHGRCAGSHARLLADAHPRGRVQGHLVESNHWRQPPPQRAIRGGAGDPDTHLFWRQKRRPHVEGIPSRWKGWHISLPGWSEQSGSERRSASDDQEAWKPQQHDEALQVAHSKIRRIYVFGCICSSYSLFCFSSLLISWSLKTVWMFPG